MAKHPIRVRITNIPPETGAEAVAGRIAELLPGTAFAGPHGTFSDPPCTITFEVAADGQSVEVALDHADGFAALMRVIVDSRWDAIDPVRKLPVDLDASSRHGALMLAIPASTSPPPPPKRARAPWEEAEPEPALELEDTPAIPEEKPQAGRLPIRQAALAIGVVAILWVAWTAWRWASRVPDVEAPSAAAETQPAAPVSIRPSVDQPAATDGRPQSDATPLSTHADAKAGAAPASPSDVDRSKIRMQQIKQLAPEFQDNPVVHQLLDYREALAEFAVSTSEPRVLAPERLADRSLFPVVWPDGLLPQSFTQPRRDHYVFHAQGKNCGHRGESLTEVDGFCDAIVYVARPAEGERGLRAFAFFTEDNRIHYRADGEAPTRGDPTVDKPAPSGGFGAAAPIAAKTSAAAKRLTNAIESAAAAAGIKSK